MPLQIIRQDITKLPCDAIVCPTDRYFSGSGGTDLAVHTAAGSRLEAACAFLPPLQCGDVAVTEGFDLDCRYILHTRGPIWQDGTRDEAQLLRSCYLNALLKAGALGIQSIAFPLISSGTFGFPKDQVLKIAQNAIADFLCLSDSDMQVYLCIYYKSDYTILLQRELEHHILGFRRDEACLAPDENVLPEEACLSASVSDDLEGASCMEAMSAPSRPAKAPKARKPAVRKPRISGLFLKEEKGSALPAPSVQEGMPQSLEQWIRQQDDTFAVTLLKLIDRKGMTDVQCYKKANVSRRTFWKINNDPAYRPSKATVLAFAIALELTLEETQQLLMTVGFALSHSSTFDMIIEFYIRRGIYDIYEINAALYQFDQALLGC